MEPSPPTAPAKSIPALTPLIHPLFCFVGKEGGIVVALRHDGDELLFCGREMTALRWVPVGQVVMDPKGIAPVELPRILEKPDEDD